MVLPSVGTIFTGAATTATGVALMNDGSDFPATDPDLLSNPNPSPDDQKNDTEYLLTPRALQAILKSWKISPYKPPSTRVTYFLSRIHTRCEEYGVPAKQHAQCAVHFMPDCREDAHAAGCANMSWDEFKAFLILYDGTFLQSMHALCLYVSHQLLSEAAISLFIQWFTLFGRKSVCNAFPVLLLRLYTVTDNQSPLIFRMNYFGGHNGPDMF